jgi:hypothetical protein
MDETKISLADRFDDWLIAHHWWPRGKPLPEKHRKPELTRWERLERFNNAIERVQRWTGSKDLKSRWWERSRERAHKQQMQYAEEHARAAHQSALRAAARRSGALNNLDTRLRNVEGYLGVITFLLLVVLIVLLVHFC